MRWWVEAPATDGAVLPVRAGGAYRGGMAEGPQHRPVARTMTAEETAALNRVRRRITAIAFFTVAIHGVLGLVVVADIIAGQDRRDGAVVLVALSAVLAVGISVAVRAILAATPFLSWPWVLVSLVPSAVGLAFVL